MQPVINLRYEFLSARMNTSLLMLIWSVLANLRFKFGGMLAAHHRCRAGCLPLVSHPWQILLASRAPFHPKQLLASHLDANSLRCKLQFSREQRELKLGAQRSLQVINKRVIKLNLLHSALAGEKSRFCTRGGSA